MGIVNLNRRKLFPLQRVSFYHFFYAIEARDSRVWSSFDDRYLQPKCTNASQYHTWVNLYYLNYNNLIIKTI